MELAEQVDLEKWHGILDRFFQILSDGVHRFEGTVNQYAGDGIMALFGAPIAHEDHAQRACYAALHLQQELRRYADEIRLEHGLGFSVRMGLNSGEVVVGKIGDDLRIDYTAQGHTVGLGARMEQMADTGKALLTGHTAKLVSGYFQLRDLGETRIKGLNELLLTGGDLTVGARWISASPYLILMGVRGVALSYLGRPGEAGTELDRAIALAQTNGQEGLLGFLHAWRVVACELSGDTPSALAHGRKAVEFAERTGNRLQWNMARTFHAIGCVVHGDWRDALVAAELGLEISRELGLTGGGTSPTM
jgi:hypothetical protein